MLKLDRKQTFFMSCKSCHDFKTVPVHNLMNLEATKNAVQKKFLNCRSMA